MSACECAACGERFTGVTAFDRHQRRDYGQTPAVTCLNPAASGLALNAYGRWGFPLDETGRAYFTARATGRTAAP
jgi:hypothetical protein